MYACFCLPERLMIREGLASGVSIDMPLRIIHCDAGLT